jgi:methionyl-tRNA formyltransferase
LKTIFFGSSVYVISIIEALKDNFELSLVITTEKSQGAVPSFCVKNKIPYLPIRQFSNSTIQQLQRIKAPIAVLADFGLIIPEEILNVFPKGIINLHPSLLPKYRGPTPVQTAILSGEKTTGISIMRLDKEIDHGPILYQEKEEILSDDTAETLYKRLFEKGAILLLNVMNKYLKNNLRLIAQEHEKATFTKPLARQDGFTDISKLGTRNSKSDLERKIRAYFPWPGVWFKTELNNTEKIIKLLPGDKLQVEGKKPMSYKDFFNGYPVRGKEIIKILSIN